MILPTANKAIRLVYFIVPLFNSLVLCTISYSYIRKNHFSRSNERNIDKKKLELPAQYPQEK
jgi:hypothetical protein